MLKKLLLLSVITFLSSLTANAKSSSLLLEYNYKNCMSKAITADESNVCSAKLIERYKAQMDEMQQKSFAKKHQPCLPKRQDRKGLSQAELVPVMDCALNAARTVVSAKGSV